MPDKKPKIRGNDPRLFEPKPRKGYRRIHRPSGIWEWKTNGYDVVVYSPKRVRFQLSAWDLEDKKQMSRDWDDYGHTVYPGDVRDYIAKHLENRV
jgi:hypothetical protein